MTTITHTTTMTAPPPLRLKRLAELLLGAWVTPRVLVYRGLRRSIGDERAMNWLSE